MIYRLLYRLMVIVPVTLSILLITLYLFYKLPGSNVLDSNRIEIGSDRELERLIQEQQSNKLFNHSKGIFYIGMQRGYIPDSLYLIPPMFRPTFINLSRDVQNPDIMDDYAVWIHSNLRNTATHKGRQLPIQQLVGILQTDSKKSLRSKTRSIRSVDSDIQDIWHKVITSPPKHDLPFLKIRWYGSQNLFHYYTLAILSGADLYTRSGEQVSEKFFRSMWWTLAYTFPVLLIGWGLAFFMVLQYYNQPTILSRMDKISVFFYSFPTFVLATLSLVFLTSHRFGIISTILPFPIFLKSETPGIRAIYGNYGQQLILPMLLFAIPVVILFYRIFLEKIKEIKYAQPSYQYLLHVGISSSSFRWRYLSKYLLVATWAILSNLFVTLLGGSLIIEWIFNIPGLGRYFYESVVNYDISSIVFLVFVFTIVQQLGHVTSDWLLDIYYTPDTSPQGLL